MTCFCTQKHFLNISSGHCTFSCASFWVANSSDFCLFIVPSTQHSAKSPWLFLYQHRQASSTASISPKALNRITLALTQLPCLTLPWSQYDLSFCPDLCFSASQYHSSRDRSPCLYETWVVLVVYCSCTRALWEKGICLFSVSLSSHIWSSTRHTANSCLTLVGWSTEATSE